MQSSFATSKEVGRTCWTDKENVALAHPNPFASFHRGASIVTLLQPESLSLPHSLQTQGRPLLHPRLHLRSRRGIASLLLLRDVERQVVSRPEVVGEHGRRQSLPEGEASAQRQDQLCRIARSREGETATRTFLALV